MNAALVNPLQDLRAHRRQAVRAVRVRRAIRLTGNVCAQWLLSSAYVPRLNQAGWDAIVRRFCGGALRALDITVDIGGPLPAGLGPLLLVANHISWLDSIAINSVRPCRYLSKSEVLTMPIFRTIIKKGGRGIFTIRESARDLLRTKDDVAAVLRGGYRIGLFAEATSTDGRRLGEFHSGLFQAAIDTSTTIQPVAISYHTAEGIPTTAAAFWGDMTMKQSLSAVIREPSLVARLEFCEPIVPGHGRRRELADEARARVAQKLKLDVPQPEIDNRRRAAGGQEAAGPGIGTV
jgi:1-acyl-sn-glycerol-3-phosphate acyltransferase